MLQNIIEIDGSLFEGGGQMLRASLALSVILQKEFQIINIRSNRPNPGINNQLLNQITLIHDIIKSDLEGSKLGSLKIFFKPLERFQPQDLVCQAQTAQSITLILQSLLPISLNCQKEINLTLYGGTYLNHSPTLSAWSLVFLPLLNKFGVKCEIQVIKEGYYPQGGGCVQAKIKTVDKKLKNITLVEISKINSLQCTYLLGQPNGIMQYNNQIVNNLKEFSENGNLQIKSETKIVNSKKFKKCYGISLLCYSDKNCYDFTKINDSDQTIESTTQAIINYAQKELQNPSCLDEHHQDQLILFMVLAEGQSQIMIGKPSLHTESLIYVIKKFLPECYIDLKEIDVNRYLLTIRGIGYEFQ